MHDSFRILPNVDRFPGSWHTLPDPRNQVACDEPCHCWSPQAFDCALSKLPIHWIDRHPHALRHSLVFPPAAAWNQYFSQRCLPSPASPRYQNRLNLLAIVVFFASSLRLLNFLRLRAAILCSMVSCFQKHVLVKKWDSADLAWGSTRLHWWGGTLG